MSDYSPEDEGEYPPPRGLEDVMDIGEYVPNEEQAQIITILRSIGQMASQAIPLLATLPDTWYDWPCAHQPYPYTCNTVPLPEGIASLPLERICQWCRQQADRPYRAGAQDGQNALMLQARAAMDAQQEPEPAPVKKAAKKAPVKRTVKRTAKKS